MGLRAGLVNEAEVVRFYAVQASLVTTPTTLPDSKECLNGMMNASVYGSVVRTPYRYE